MKHGRWSSSMHTLEAQDSVRDKRKGTSDVFSSVHCCWPSCTTALSYALSEEKYIVPTKKAAMTPKQCSIRAMCSAPHWEQGVYGSSPPTPAPKHVAATTSAHPLHITRLRPASIVQNPCADNTHTHTYIRDNSSSRWYIALLIDNGAQPTN